MKHPRALSVPLSLLVAIPCGLVACSAPQGDVQATEGSEAGYPTRLVERKPVPCVPGLVAWNDGYEGACLAAEGSNKPVVLVEVFGHLDEALC